MTNKIIHNIVQELISLGLIQESNIKKYSINEILKLEKTIGYKLPETYKEFLLTIGKGSGDIFKDFYYPYITEFTNNVRDLLEENNNPFILSESYFVFCIDSGESFFYFDLLDGDDPPVYYYFEGQEEPKKIHNSF